MTAIRIFPGIVSISHISLLRIPRTLNYAYVRVLNHQRTARARQSMAQLRHLRQDYLGCGSAVVSSKKRASFIRCRRSGRVVGTWGRDRLGVPVFFFFGWLVGFFGVWRLCDIFYATYRLSSFPSSSSFFCVLLRNASVPVVLCKYEHVFLALFRLYDSCWHIMHLFAAQTTSSDAINNGQIQQSETETKQSM